MVCKCMQGINLECERRRHLVTSVHRKKNWMEGMHLITRLAFRFAIVAVSIGDHIATVVKLSTSLGAMETARRA